MFHFLILDFEALEHIEMSGYDIKAENSAIATPVKPFNAENPILDGKELSIKLKPLSWNVIRLAKKK